VFIQFVFGVVVSLCSKNDVGKLVLNSTVVPGTIPLCKHLLSPFDSFSSRQENY
jgi:hypothetical protein